MTGKELRARREALGLGRYYMARKADGALPLNTQEYLEDPGNMAVLNPVQVCHDCKKPCERADASLLQCHSDQLHKEYMKRFTENKNRSDQ